MDKKTVTLWKEYNGIFNELKKQLNSTSNLTGDYAEHLVCDYLNGELLTASHKSADIKANGKLYQVKARKISEGKSTTQLGIIRSWDFDFLVVVLFDEKGDVKKAIIVPVDVAKRYAVANEYQKGYVISTTNDFITDEGNEDITDAMNERI